MNQHVEIPALAERSRILSAAQTAKLFGVSLPHFRRLHRAGKVPAGIKVGDRKLGWQLGPAMDFLANKNKDAA